MPDTAARLALYARRNEVARFTIVVTGIDLTGVAMAMQVRLNRGVPGPPLIALATVATLAAEGLKLDSVTVTNGVPTSTIKGRINQSTMSDAAKVPYAGELGSDTTLAYAMQWTLNGDAQTRIEGDWIVRDTAFGSDNAPTNRPEGYGSRAAHGSASGSLAFGDQIIQVSIQDSDLLLPLISAATTAAQSAQASAALLLTNSEPTSNTLAGQVDPTGRWSSRLMPDGSLRIAKLQDARGRRLDQLIDTNTDAVTVLQGQTARAILTNTESAANTLEAQADAQGRWPWRVMADGAFRMAKPQDATGRRLDLAIDVNTAALATVQAQLALAPPIQRQRLKRALYDGQARRVMTADPLTVPAFTTASAITGGTTYAKDSPRVRLLGGKWVAGASYPGGLFMSQRSVTYNGSTSGLGNGNTVFEFVLVGDSFEFVNLGNGGNGNFQVEIDGVATNDAGYPMSAGNTGAITYQLVNLPAGAGVARRIRVTTNLRPFGGLTVPAGATLLDPTPALPASMVVIGDSITEGSVATLGWRRFAAQLGYRLGIDNNVIAGVGGSGYLAALGYNGTTARQPGFPDYRFRERINDVLTAINGGPPDLVVVAGGINDPVTPAALTAEALLYLQALRAAAPDMVIIVMGPFSADAPYSSDLITKRDAIFAAAAQVKRVSTVDVSSWYARADRSTWFNGGVNGPHPIDAGHFAYGQLAADAIAPIIGAF